MRLQVSITTVKWCLLRPRWMVDALDGEGHKEQSNCVWWWRLKVDDQMIRVGLMVKGRRTFWLRTIRYEVR